MELLSQRRSALVPCSRNLIGIDALEPYIPLIFYLTPTSTHREYKKSVNTTKEGFTLTSSKSPPFALLSVCAKHMVTRSPADVELAAVKTSEEKSKQSNVSEMFLRIDYFLH